MWGWGGIQAHGQRLCQTCTESVLVNQSCLTLCDPMDSSLPGSSVHGILQARILDWVAIPFPRDLPDPGIKPGSPALQEDSLPSQEMSEFSGRVCLPLLHWQADSLPLHHLRSPLFLILCQFMKGLVATLLSECQGNLFRSPLTF